jgi:hypothetical protein
MLFAAKCYWPGLSATDFDHVATEIAAAASSGSGASTYVGSIVFPRDDLVLCLLESRSRSAVQGIADRAAIPCERIMEALWLAPPVNRRGRLRRRARPGSALETGNQNQRRMR